MFRSREASGVLRTELRDFEFGVTGVGVAADG